MIKITSLNQKIKPFYKIQDIKVNKAKYFKIKITEKLHNKFIKLSGDDSPIHLDNTFVKKNLFKKKICHGFLITSILSQIYGTDWGRETEPQYLCRGLIGVRATVSGGL